MTILGIDLGTTNTLCAVFVDNKSLLIPNVHGEYMTPSAIAINDDDEIIVGKAALDYSSILKYQNVKGFKRYMGTNKVFQLGNNKFRAEELSAIILQKIKKDAEMYLNITIESAIISVPAYFNNKQRQATKIAGEIAGLKVIRLVNEPTAAAITYGITQKDDSTKYMIFDLGGGTFDVTVIELFNGIIEVRSSAGDNFLGGNDFTDFIVQDFCNNSNLAYDRLNKVQQNKLWNMAEKCKIEINKNICTHQFEMSMSDNNTTYSYTYDVNKLDILFKPLVDRLMHPIKRSLNDSRLDPNELSAVVFVGGGSKIQTLSKICTKLFKKLPFTYHDPQLVVVMGVATLAGMYENNVELKDYVLTDVSPYTLGVSCVSGDDNIGYELEYAPIIERNSTIPTSKSRIFYTHPKQDKISINVYQGESRKLDNNIKISEFELNMGSSSNDVQEVHVRFTYDMNGILEVNVNLPKNNMSKNVVIRESCGNMTNEEISKALENIKDLKIHPRDCDVNTAVISRAERMYEESLGEVRDEVSRAIKIFLNMLDQQNDNDINIARNKFNDFLNTLEYTYE